MTGRDPNAARRSGREALVGAYERAGYRLVAPPILQPAEPFLDLSGEDIRKRMYLTVDADGRELCLRPDLTIPVSCDYLASPEPAQPQGFCYLGPVYRDRGALPAEIFQAGIESFGRPDKAAADAEMLALGLEATAHYGIAESGNPHGRRRPVLGAGRGARSCAGLEAASGQGLQPQDFARARSRRAHFEFGREQAEYQGVLAALESSDPKAAHALVTDLLSIAGISAVGGRTVGEIAERFLEQAAIGAATALPRETRTLIEKFLAVAGDPDEAAAELRSLSSGAGGGLGPALDLFESRTGFLAARGIEVGSIKFSTAFGRGLDYYTGFVFELHDPRRRRTARWSQAAATTNCSPGSAQGADPGGGFRGLGRARQASGGVA